MSRSFNSQFREARGILGGCQEEIKGVALVIKTVCIVQLNGMKDDLWCSCSIYTSVAYSSALAIAKRQMAHCAASPLPG